MRFFKSKYLLLFIICINVNVYAQHTPLLTQYMFNGLLNNPGFAGSNEVLTLSVSDRHQWIGFDGAPVTQIFTAHTPLKNENIGLGILLYRDVIGKSYDNGLYGTYTYHLKIRGGKLSLGLTGGISFKQKKLSEINTTQPGDVVFLTNTPLSVLPNLSIGAYYFCSRFFAGISTPFILTETFDKKTGKLLSVFDSRKNNFMFTGGYNYTLNKNYTIKPSFLWRINLTSGQQTEINIAVENKKIGGVGIGYRIKDAVIILLKIRINNQMFLGYSYDMSVSELSSYNYGTHEFYLTYQFRYESKTVSSRFF
ncbi:MAG TPA: type IX secretion system membrane protein PorP/SprF [Bacteroidales bacterium]|nr:type IX secretion system membrane protein PorP/SprF [Bacteroidales bacterium]